MIGFQQNLTDLRHSAFRLAYAILKDREAAENLVQEVLLELWILKDEAYAIANLRMHILKKIRIKGLESITGVSEAIEETDHAEPDDRMARAAFKVNHLSELERTALQLRDVEALDYSEVAEIMELAEAELRTILSGARRKIKQSLLVEVKHE